MRTAAKETQPIYITPAENPAGPHPKPPNAIRLLRSYQSLKVISDNKINLLYMITARKRASRNPPGRRGGYTVYQTYEPLVVWLSETKCILQMLLIFPFSCQNSWTFRQLNVFLKIIEHFR